MAIAQNKAITIYVSTLPISVETADKNSALTK